MEESITRLRLDDVYPHPQQEAYRPLDPGHVDDLAASIAVVGQLDPIHVFADGEAFIIDSGHHRHAAMKKLGLPEIEAIVIDYDKAESVKIMVASNLYRPDTELERSRGTQMMLTLGVRPIDAAALIGEKNPDRIERAKRGMAVVNDETACEDLTIDRLIAAGDFEDDPEALNKLICAPGDTWPRVHADLLRARRVKAAVAECERVVAESGCELTTQRDYTNHHFLAHAMEVPDGAKYALISVQEWSGSAEISWYDDAAEQAEDPEANARREAAEARRTELAAAFERRLAFLAEYLNSTTPVSLSNALRDLAEKCWEDGYSAEVGSIAEALSGVTGWCPRIYAAILSDLDGELRRAADCPEYNRDYYWTENGPFVVAYLEALADSGLEAVGIETSLLVELREFLAAKAEDATEDEAEEPVCVDNGEACPAFTEVDFEDGEAS